MRNRTSRNALAIAVIGLALLAFSGALLAQQLTGNIFGNATDEGQDSPASPSHFPESAPQGRRRRMPGASIVS
jgi:hypothetical protein